MPPARRGTKDPTSASDAERRDTGAANAGHIGERNTTKEKKETAVTKAKDKYKHFSHYLYPGRATYQNGRIRIRRKAVREEPKCKGEAEEACG